MESKNNETVELPDIENNDNSDNQEQVLSLICGNELTQPTEITTNSINRMNYPITEDSTLRIIRNSSFTNDNQTHLINTSIKASSLYSGCSYNFPSTSAPITRQLPTSSYTLSSKSPNLPDTSDELPTLFHLCLAKLNESNISLSMLKTVNATGHQFESSSSNPLTLKLSNVGKSAGLTTPDSLTSAPPSYSFVLRQMNMRRRPRLMGTFIPSPSFILHAPPPTYATAFDIYVDNPIPPPPRAYNFGFTPIPVICPRCGYAGMSIVTSKVTICTHLCAAALCIFCCWFCAPLPYVLRSCKNVYHYCRNCRSLLGIYCPTNPENVY